MPPLSEAFWAGDRIVRRICAPLFVLTNVVHWLIVLLFLAFCMGVGLYELASQELSMRMWEKAEGTIINCQTVWQERRQGDGGFPTLKAEVRYSYVVSGTRYEGTRIKLNGPVLYSAQEAKTFREKHSPGAAVEIWYAPYYPLHAALIVERNELPWIPLGTGIILLLSLVFVRWKNKRQRNSSQ